MSREIKMSGIYTIGHSNHSLDTLLKLLRANAIEVVVDVRSAPYSKYVPQFNKHNLESELPDKGFRYLFMGDSIGGKPDNPAFRETDGTIDYNSIAATEKFQHGIDRLVKGAAEGWTIALLCAEKQPANCHRHHLIARELEYNRNIAVFHIRADGQLERARNLLQNQPRQINLFLKYAILIPCATTQYIHL